MSARKENESPESVLRGERLEEIQRAWRRGFSVLTIELTGEYERLDPGQWHVAYRRGDSLALVGRISEALGMLSEALRRSRVPWHRAHTAESLGAVHAARGDREEAESWFRHAVAACPTSARYAWRLARFLHGTERREEAERVLLEAVANAEEDREYGHAALGTLRRRQRRFEDAGREFLAALEIDPEYEAIAAALEDVEEAALCAELRMEERATRLAEVNTESTPATGRELARAALEECEDDWTARRVRALSLWELRLFPEARAVYEVRHDAGLSDRLFHSFVGRIFVEEHRCGDAERAFRLAAAAEPDHAHPLIELVRMRLDSGEPGEAEDLAREATAAANGCIDEAHYLLGLALRGQGRYPAALEAFERAVELDPDYVLAKARIQDLEEWSRRFPHR